MYRYRIIKLNFIKRSNFMKISLSADLCRLYQGIISRFTHYTRVSLRVKIITRKWIIPTVIPCGNSLLSMTIGKNVLFRDSNLFFKSKLANLPKFFGFENMPVLRRSTDGTITEISKETKISKGIYPE